MGLAVSGGPDSLALLLLAAAALPDGIAVATIDHGLRVESAAEAAYVGEVCAALDAPHAVLKVEVATGNLQAEARAARYAALADWAECEGLAAVATAHHADDQVETLLMRLNRRSGVAGLAGIRVCAAMPGSNLDVVRPLLGWRREELAALLVNAGLTPVTDPSNSEDRFDRVRLRKALADADWLNVPSIAASAIHLADADAALDWAAMREWSERVGRDGSGLVYRPQAPRAVAIRVIGLIVEALADSPPRGSAAARLFDALVAGETTSIGDLMARPLAHAWSFAKAPSRRT